MVLQLCNWAEKFCTVALFPCTLRIQMLITAHPAGEAPLPWHNPCVLILIPPPANVLESPKPVQRNNFMFSIAPNIDSIVVVGMPNAWNIIEAIACAILSWQLEALTDAIAVGTLACLVIL
jgi:hypothetical protein